MSDLLNIAGSLDGYRKDLLSEGFYIAKSKGYEIDDEGMLCDWLLENNYDYLANAINKTRNYINKLDETGDTMAFDYLWRFKK